MTHVLYIHIVFNKCFILQYLILVLKNNFNLNNDFNWIFIMTFINGNPETHTWNLRCLRLPAWNQARILFPIYNPPFCYLAKSSSSFKMSQKSVSKSSYINRSLRYKCHCGMDVSLMTTWTNPNPGCRFYDYGMYKVWFCLCYFWCSSLLCYITTDVSSFYSIDSCRCKVTRSVATLFDWMKKWTQE